MPNGRTHTNITLTACLLTSIAIPFVPDPSIPISIFAGCFTGIFLTPDLDVEEGSISMYHVRRFGGNAGNLLSTLWLYYWLPYAKLIPHRDWRSHFPIISTIIRLLYLFCVPLILYLVINEQDGMNQIHSILTSKFFIFFFIGLCFSDTLHYVADRTISRLRSL